MSLDKKLDLLNEPVEVHFVGSKVFVYNKDLRVSASFPRGLVSDDEVLETGVVVQRYEPISRRYK